MNGRFALTQAAQHNPAIKAYQSGGAAEPRNCRGFHGAQVLSCFLELGGDFWSKSQHAGRLTPPSPRRPPGSPIRLSASAQTNNIALLAYSMVKASSSILTLYASITITSSRIAAWQTMIHCNFCLHLSSILDAVKKNLLDGPISPDGLFGPQFQSVVNHLQMASEEAEKIQKHVAWSQPTTCPNRFFCRHSVCQAYLLSWMHPSESIRAHSPCSFNRFYLWDVSCRAVFFPLLCSMLDCYSV